jgi:hypothetical protein
MHCHGIGLAVFVALVTASCSQAIATSEEDAAVLLAAVSPCDGDPGILLSATLNAAVQEESAEHEASRLSLDQAYSQAIKDLRARNPGSVPLPKEFACRKLQVVPLTAIGSERGAINWETVHRSFPGVQRVIKISLPGYSRDRDRAIVEVSMTCGLLCGSDELVELQRSNGKWERVTQVTSANQ